jgi:hypothetical protein
MMGDLCVAGMCDNSCSNGTTECDGGCYTTAQFATNPLHCGACGTACTTSQVCAQGTCQNYFVPPMGCGSCATCDCGAGNTCCAGQSPGLGSMQPICVAGSHCPG